MSGVNLRIVRPADLDTFDEAFQTPDGAGEFQWFGFFNSRDLRAELDTRLLLGGEANMLSVERAGVLVGRVEWLARYWGRRDTSRCWEIAVGILPEFRRQGIGTAAQSLLVTYLFDNTPVQRIQATTDPGNVAEIRCLEKLGFTLEGRVRAAQWRQGAWRDQLLYSRVRNQDRSG